MSRDIKQIDGTIIEVSPEELRRIARAERNIQANCKTLNDLIALAKRTGKSKYWAHHIWRARQDKMEGKAAI